MQHSPNSTKLPGKTAKDITMSYNRDFPDLGSALEKLSITWVIQNKKADLYQNLSREFLQEKGISPSSLFLELFHHGKSIYLNSAKRLEEMRKNRLILPFLFEMEIKHPKLRVWEAVSIDADHSQGLTGEPDYCVTKEDVVPKAPYCIIVEAKQKDFDEGWGQSLAAMKGAQIVNQRLSSRDISIYGVVTTGEEWQWGKLTIDSTTARGQFLVYPQTPINVLENEEKVNRVLGLLHIVFEECEKNIEE